MNKPLDLLCQYRSVEKTRYYRLAFCTPFTVVILVCVESERFFPVKQQHIELQVVLIKLSF